MGLRESNRSFAEEIGANDPVWIVGHGTRTEPHSHVRHVRAPRGIHSFEPDEMTVTCGAGTSLAELDAALAGAGQYANLGQLRHSSGTVGGAIAMACNDHLRLGRGPIRDSLLEVHLVDGNGILAKGGGPTVKNVSGFDLCRLVVGSRGSLGAIAEVTLRTRPIARSLRWFIVSNVGTSELGAIRAGVHRPSSLLWDGRRAWLCLEGHPHDIATQVEALRSRGLDVTDHHGDIGLGDFQYRWSIDPTDVIACVEQHPESCIAEVGVGIVHHRRAQPPRIVDPGTRAIQSRLLDAFDPRRRLNPGLGDPWTW
ncbi:MAG: FAD-binding protein [Actinobacteria bacterium]|nr:FAD-binding protein [Actinomycetota bacterium]